MANKKIEKTVTQNKYRPPIVTIMGHVDHGKTSILDAIRKTHVTEGESGGITQHTAAYTVERNGNKIIFIDTPGHAAFTEMRRRGGAAADIVILVVAADDGVMPQTKEAIMHAKLAKVPIIVALNKIDIPGVNKDKVKKQLSDNGIILEEYGGEIVVVETSATKNIGIDNLLDMINLVSDMQLTDSANARLVADKENPLEALVIESLHAKRQGILVTAIIKNGTLAVRQNVVVKSGAKLIEAKVKSVKKFENNVYSSVNEAFFGDVVEILGFNIIPVAGDVIRPEGFDYSTVTEPEVATDDTTSIAETDEVDKKKALNVIVRSDTSGTLEALVESLKKLSYEDVKVNIILSGTGDIKESDILMANSSHAIVLAFRVNVDSFLQRIAEESKIIVSKYDIIYKLLEDIEGALEGVVEIEEEKIKGRGLVIKVFTLPKSNSKIAGTLVLNGRFKVNQRVAIYRGDTDIAKSSTPLYYSRIKSIHEGVKEVETSSKGSECGLLFKPELADIELDDRIEVL